MPRAIIPRRNECLPGSMVLQRRAERVPAQNYGVTASGGKYGLSRTTWAMSVVEAPLGRAYATGEISYVTSVTSRKTRYGPQ